MIHARRHPSSFLPSLLAAVALAGAAGGVHAQSSPYYVGAAQSIGYESNLLRLGDGQAVPAGFSKSDTVSVTSLLAGFDQPISRQRVYANAALRALRYADNGVYDNEGYTLAAGIDWETINRISGTVRANADRTLSSFNTNEIGLLTRKNLQTTESIDATVRVGGVTRLTFEGGAGWRKVDNSLDQPNVQARNYSQRQASAGVRYWPSAASSFGLSLRGAEGEYPRFRFDGTDYRADRYSRRDVEASAVLVPSAISSFDVRLRYGKTSYDVAQRRDFSGLTGSASWTWRPTGKLRFTTRVWRDTGQDSYAVELFDTATTSDYSRVTTALRVRADHDWTAKVAFDAALQYSHRDLVRTIDNPFVPLEARGRDKALLATLGVRWTPRRSIAVGCEVGAERVDASGQIGFDLTANRASCYGQFMLQ